MRELNGNEWFAFSWFRFCKSFALLYWRDYQYNFLGFHILHIYFLATISQSTKWKYLQTYSPILYTTSISLVTWFTNTSVKFSSIFFTYIWNEVWLGYQRLKLTSTHYSVHSIALARVPQHVHPRCWSEKNNIINILYSDEQSRLLGEYFIASCQPTARTISKCRVNVLKQIVVHLRKML